LIESNFCLPVRLQWLYLFDPPSTVFPLCTMVVGDAWTLDLPSFACLLAIPSQSIQRGCLLYLYLFGRAKLSQEAAAAERRRARQTWLMIPIEALRTERGQKEARPINNQMLPDTIDVQLTGDVEEPSKLGLPATDAHVAGTTIEGQAGGSVGGWWARKIVENRSSGEE
jgi:hypothetical protein